MMEKLAIFGLYILNILGANCFSAQLDSDFGKEPQCRSQFDYEYKVVQKLVALENLCENLKGTNSQLRAELSEMRLEIKAATNELRAEVQAATDELKVVQTKTNELEDLKTTSAGKKFNIIWINTFVHSFDDNDSEIIEIGRRFSCLLIVTLGIQNDPSKCLRHESSEYIANCGKSCNRLSILKFWFVDCIRFFVRVILSHGLFTLQVDVVNKSILCVLFYFI